MRFAISMALASLAAMNAMADEQQRTFTPKNHNLDNNDNFSPDDSLLCYDTREMIGPGIENSQTVEVVHLESGEETVLFTPEKSITGAQAAPGIGAVSFAHHASVVAFIHGPPVDDVAERGYYGKPNRNGATVPADGSQRRTWLDHRDVATDRPTTPGAHRGGTHRHEYCRANARIGFTYDDFLLPQYDRTIGFLEPHEQAPAIASHYFAILVPVPPMGTAKPGEIEKAYGDSWIDPEGTMRGFIGKVRIDDGETYEESLFVVEIPADVDVTTAHSGDVNTYPTPPEGVSVRRLTWDFAQGILRGSVDGSRIAFYRKDEQGVLQLAVIPSDGSDRAEDPAKRSVTVTRFSTDAGPGVRWHPSGNSLACIHDNAVAVISVKEGPTFGKVRYLTPRGEGPERLNLVWSHDGKTLAYNKAVPTKGADGAIAKNYDGSDCLQIFTVNFPDADEDGVADGLE